MAHGYGDLSDGCLACISGHLSRAPVSLPLFSFYRTLLSVHLYRAGYDHSRKFCFVFFYIRGDTEYSFPIALSLSVLPLQPCLSHLPANNDETDILPRYTGMFFLVVLNKSLASCLWGDIEYVKQRFWKQLPDDVLGSRLRLFNNKAKKPLSRVRGILLQDQRTRDNNESGL